MKATIIEELEKLGFTINKHDNVFPPRSFEKRGTRIMAFKENGRLGFRSKLINKNRHPDFLELMECRKEDTMDLRLDPTKVKLENIITALSADLGYPIKK